MAHWNSRTAPGSTLISSRIEAYESRGCIILGAWYITYMFIKEVRTHAIENYDHASEGWDYIVEAHTDEELARLIGPANSPEQAIENCRNVVKVLRERDHDAENSAW